MGHLPIRPPRPQDALWREMVGQVLRRRRQERGARIADIARAAGVSGQYLSEIERGRKDPSSEMLAAILGALGLTLADLTREVHVRLAMPVVTATGPAAVPDQPGGRYGSPARPLAMAA